MVKMAWERLLALFMRVEAVTLKFKEQKTHDRSSHPMLCLLKDIANAVEHKQHCPALREGFDGMEKWVSTAGSPQGSPLNPHL